MAMSCQWKLSTPPRPRQTTGSVLDNLRCVGQSAIHQEGDTIRNVSEAASKDTRKTDKDSQSLPSALYLRSFKNSEIFLLSIDTRCIEPRQVMPHIRSSCLSRCSTAHWASYSSSDFQVLSTASQGSCGTRTKIRSQTKREGVDYRQREMQRKSTSRIGRNSLKPVTPLLFQKPCISQCAGITPVSEQGEENTVKCHEVKMKTPLFRQHYEVMFQDAPWRPLRSSNKRPLTVSSCGTSKLSGGPLATVPSNTCLEAPCCTPNMPKLVLQLEGLQLHGVWLNSRDTTQGTRTSGAATKDLQLVALERANETAYNGKLECERAWDAASSDPISPNESVGSTRWDPGQLKVTVTKKQREKKQSWT
ncbi:uncharacterized protein LOC121715770 [Alosa sapidissima]|uniref:uncharacterized protein LOC121715770 n=1 Tax=Alosa sapidissima TaxID=34773 RepID=UPI001C0941F1|nr:uncharacterized protein LOC121715770 [Alosa sapidissima]XP_041957621.1 uncharacterized protein LOC121715770 [Alosa sapidissima]